VEALPGGGEGDAGDESYVADVADPAQVGEIGIRASPTWKYKRLAALSADPGAHVRQVKLIPG